MYIKIYFLHIYIMSIVENLPTGDELNKYLENINFNEELKTLQEEQLKIKQLINKLKQSNHMKKWHENNRDLYNYKARLKMREHYRNNEEYRTQSLKDKRKIL